MKKEIYGEEEEEEKNGEKNEVNYMQNDLRHALRFNIPEGQGRKRLELWVWAYRGERKNSSYAIDRSISSRHLFASPTFHSARDVFFFSPVFVKLANSRINRNPKSAKFERGSSTFSFSRDSSFFAWGLFEATTHFSRVLSRDAVGELLYLADRMY